MGYGLMNPVKAMIARDLDDRDDLTDEDLDLLWDDYYGDAEQLWRE